MPSQKGFAHFLIFPIALLGIGIAVYLTQFSQIFKPQAADPADVAFQSHYNPFGDPWNLSTGPNPDIPVAYTSGCYRRGPKWDGRTTNPEISETEADYLSKSNAGFIFEECATVQGPTSLFNRQRLINLATKIKQKNPQAKFIGYAVVHLPDTSGNGFGDIIAAANAGQNCGSVKCETFFIHKKGGDKNSKADRLGGSVFDITNSNFRKYIAGRYATALKEMNMDGFFVDGITSTVPMGNLEDIPDEIKNNWEASWGSLFREIKASIGGKLVFAQASNQSPKLVRIMLEGGADGVMLEDPLERVGYDPLENRPEVNEVLSITASLNKYALIAVNTNINNNPPCNTPGGPPLDRCFQATNRQKEISYSKYYLAAYLNLLKNNKTVMLYYTPLRTSPQFDSETFFKDWNLRIGQPTGERETVAPGIYRRRFQNAHVYWNPSDNNYPVPGSGELFSLDGKPMSGQVVAAKSGVMFVSRPVLDRFNMPPSSSAPAATLTIPASSPSFAATENALDLDSVYKLERKITLNPQGEATLTFWTSKQNEISFLTTSRSFINKGAAFKTAPSGDSNAVMAKRLALPDTQNKIQFHTWAIDIEDINSLKSRGFTEATEGDFYVYPTKQPGTIGITRMSRATGNSKFYTFAVNEAEITSLESQGWLVDKANVFYAVP